MRTIEIPRFDICPGCFREEGKLYITGICSSNAIRPENLPDGEYSLNHSSCGWKAKLVVERRYDGLHYSYEDTDIR